MPDEPLALNDIEVWTIIGLLAAALERVRQSENEPERDKAIEHLDTMLKKFTRLQFKK